MHPKSDRDSTKRIHVHAAVDPSARSCDFGPSKDRDKVLLHGEGDEDTVHGYGVIVFDNPGSTMDGVWEARRRAAKTAVQDASAAKMAQRRVVCRYWLDNKCSSGDFCPYLHMFVESAMPLCKLEFRGGKAGFCAAGDRCKFRHALNDGEAPPRDQFITGTATFAR